MSAGDVASRLAEVEARTCAACQRAGRARQDVSLLAVSKLQPAAAIREAYAAGQRDFGENYAQELRDKAAELAEECPEIRWHAIGPLQANKAKYVAKAAAAFHALDRLELAQELSRRRVGAPLQCFLEVNLAGEASKSGVAPADVARLLDEVRSFPNLEVVGLMSLPPFPKTPEESRPAFRSLSALAKSVGLKALSMGTTADFEVAIEEGATHVRVGTAIFGERQR